MIMRSQKVRYAVVGMGWIAQEAVLPAFAHAGDNSELTALFSDDKKKLDELGRKYRVPHLCLYDDYDEFLRDDNVDAVYIALPNSLHHEYTIRAAQAGVHVLCEKPLAMSERECVEMIHACRKHKVKLMTAYRLHFEEGNLKAMELSNAGKLGDVRTFNSLFALNVAEGNTRLSVDLAGGPLYDIGIYCINAARTVFRDEPQAVYAMSVKGTDKRFKEVEEMISGLLHFPGERLASFTCSFGVASVSTFEVLGSKGRLRVDPAFHHNEEVKHFLKVNGQEKESVFPARDQFAPEIVYFSDCIIKDRDPEPSGMEGWADVRIIEALLRSAKDKKTIFLPDFDKTKWPSLKQFIKRPKPSKPELVHARPPKKK